MYLPLLSFGFLYVNKYSNKMPLRDMPLKMYTIGPPYMKLNCIVQWFFCQFLCSFFIQFCILHNYTNEKYLVLASIKCLVIIFNKAGRMCKIELDWSIKNKIYYSTALSPFSQYFQSRKYLFWLYYASS